MRLLFLSNDPYPPLRVDVADLVATRLPARGYQVDWLLLAGTRARTAREEPYGGGVARIGRSLGRSSALATLATACLDLAHDLRLPVVAWRRRPEIVVVRDKTVAALVALVVARWLRTRFVYWHSFPIADAALTAAREGCTRRPWLAVLRGHLTRLLLYRLVLPRASHVFVQSERMASDLEAVGVPRPLMTPVPMGVGLERLPLPYPVTRVAKPSRASWIVYVGTLARIRRIDVVVEAAARVRASHPEAVLWLVGAGDNAEDERAIRRAVERHGLAGTVGFTGFLPAEQAWEYVALADVCISPFRDIPILQSTSPTKLVEYMALARPVVASRHPEQDRILAESGAGVSVPFAPEAFAEAIIALLDDPARRTAMGRRGRAWVEKHRHYDRLADVVDARLRSIVAGGAASHVRAVRPVRSSRPGPGPL